MTNPLINYARSAVDAVPAVRAHLDMPTRYALARPAVKTYDYMVAVITRAVKNVYDGLIGGDFVDILGSLLKGQVKQAFESAWTDGGNDMPLPDYLLEAMANDQESQANFDYIYNFYKAIIDARVDKTPIDPLLSRVDSWAHQYDVEYKAAQEIINLKSGGNLRWEKGATEHGCRTCADLDGIVARADEWETLGVHPRGYPNPLLQCEGGGPVNNCDCTLGPTDQRRSPRAFETIMNIVNK